MHGASGLREHAVTYEFLRLAWWLILGVLLIGFAILVCFILAGGATFAAFPLLYAMAFSGLYVAMILLLAAFILRPVSFSYRNKYTNPQWRNAWDWVLTVSGSVP